MEKYMADPQISILVADDNPDNLKVLSGMLKELDFKIRIATNGEEALASLERKSADLVLLDIHMPKMDGYEACRRIKSDPSLKDIPVIFMSSLSEEFNKVKGFELGAVDYITKPLQMEETKARISVHMELYHKRKMLETFNESLVNRELRIVELKKEVNELSKELNRDIPYKSVDNEI